MLVISRKPGTAVRVGKTWVVVLGVQGNTVKLGIDAPKEETVWREDMKTKPEESK